MSLSCLADTDWVIHYLNGVPGVVGRLEQLSGEGVAVSVISLAELYEGVFYSLDAVLSERMLRDFLGGVTVLGADDGICRISGRERGRLRAAGQTIGDMDLLIGATAPRHNLTLLANNWRHFQPIENLTLESS